MSKLNKLKKRNIALGAEEEPVVEPSNEPVEEPTNEEPVVEPTDDDDEDEEEPKEKAVLNPKPNKGWAYPGYVPSRGEENSWYEPDEKVRPRVYHKYAKEDVYKTLYPDLINKEEENEEPVDPETPVDPVEPTDPVEPGEPSEPIDPEPTEPVEPSEPTDPEDPGVDPGNLPEEP